jgi:hypothetical protein
MLYGHVHDSFGSRTVMMQVEEEEDITRLQALFGIALAEGLIHETALLQF